MTELNNQPASTPPLPSGWAALRQRFTRWSEAVGLPRKMAIAVAGAAIVSGLATYGAMSGDAPFDSDPGIVLILLNIDLVLLLILGAIVSVRLVRLWIERRRGSAGSRLNTRLVGLFSLVSVTPTIVVAVFSALFLNFGLQAWFSRQVSTALDQSLVVAEAYVAEHRENIRGDALAMANDLNSQAPYLAQSPGRLNQMVNRLAELRSLTDAAVLSRNGRILARSGLSFALELERIPEPFMLRAAAGEVVILTSETDDRVRALVRLVAFVDAYLFVGRFVESSVLKNVQQVQGAVGEYKRAETRQSIFQVTFVLIFVVVALLMLLASVWVGLVFSNQLVRPISGLILAAERVRTGELSARVEEGDPRDEIGSLSRAFNRMTGQLEEQREELVEANRQLDERRQFTEAVLGGVSAGVVGLDANGLITLPNRSALGLLEANADAVIGRSVEDAIPEMAHLLREAQARPNRLIEEQVELGRSGRKRTLLVRIVAEIVDENIIGYVVTFDDITALVSAQRTAAWADVARRIAHEIKNPLTPIQLSAERLKRKYLNEITSEPDIFSACTDTIVRQVGDIRQMVDEFSAFARMPTPVMQHEDLGQIARHAVLLQRVANPDIEFILDLAEVPVTMDCDSRQLGQCLTNLLKNAVEAIEGREDGLANAEEAGKIIVHVREENDDQVIEIEDNGPGLPAENRERLTEPYVTTRARGTGLGLAIVSKIMEDHDGAFSLSDRPGGGAIALLRFTTATQDNIRKGAASMDSGNDI
ncbi:MAG: PAS domain-containing sensor histidine kinase [Rhodospirillaceae bacterium]|nr:PAS domain-containing sensor histidine kinase [Rhodospirillaceae bacterium]MBT4426935.1 PAS domain-containing sensor histidine kinase [Rhodospirillaceae bacterium]MBT5780210.1 PAS domain-containing sensor histidine kinase [Rhodospirillaceae bacterium]MBT6828443.1 PAS domain-containing sensor histidine kinase [Rhodospirillaceae bacterium]MBT7291459.1 PAS domain-containing sensor histidine kinase [Rhodospirillaceae bacterium]